MKFQEKIQWLIEQLEDLEISSEKRIQKLTVELIDMKEKRKQAENLSRNLIATERQRIRKGLENTIAAVVTIQGHLACLSCELVKTDLSMLQCGHNVCTDCVNEHSNTAHHRSLIRCEICSMESSVGQVGKSIPHSKICTSFVDVKKELSMLVLSDSALQKEEMQLRFSTASISLKELGKSLTATVTPARLTPLSSSLLKFVN